MSADGIGNQGFTWSYEEIPNPVSRVLRPSGYYNQIGGHENGSSVAVSAASPRASVLADVFPITSRGGAARCLHLRTRVTTIPMTTEDYPNLELAT